MKSCELKTKKRKKYKEKKRVGNFKIFSFIQQKSLKINNENITRRKEKMSKLENLYRLDSSVDSNIHECLIV